MRALFPLLLLAFAVGCSSGGGGGGDDGSIHIGDEDSGPMGPEVVCNEMSRRVEGIEGPLDCDGEPAYVEVLDRGRPYHIFTYEASHPLATETQAFPCAASQGATIEAPDVATEACSVAGVRPWHSVRWRDADKACTAIGWRLCSSEELDRACGGESGYAYPYGNQFSAGLCNVREAFLAAGAEFSTEAPTGHFADCVTQTGIFDLTGNLWEWSNDREPMDPDARSYHNAGWKTVAERHRDSDLVCGTRTALNNFTAPSFAGPTVGFRCCRDAP
ncbi:MAG: SUMF1/EgtB/PvdO family nonheme iron enzyme [Myxococcales bacterium]|nr:SUMF1/EgtB/PvdO family nonheme iron enzyme [Myxococcales bacterium]